MEIYRPRQYTRHDCSYFSRPGGPDSFPVKFKRRWGIGHIVGKTGQAHADVMEAIFKCSHKNRCDSDKNSPTFGAIEILVDPHAIRKIAAGKQGGHFSGQQLDVLLTDLMQVVISLSGNDVYPMRKLHH